MNAEPENEIQNIGRKLLELAQKEEAAWLKKHQWENALLDWCMANPELKIRTFRFIDVFPTLKSPRSVLNHIREYFPLSEQRIPQVIRTGLLLARPAILTQNAVQYLTRAMFLKIAKLFVAAPNEEEAMAVLDQLHSEGMTASIDLLGEKTMSEVEADEYVKRYQTLMTQLGAKKLGIEKQNISVKLSALDPFFDPIDPEGTSERVRGRLRGLIHTALKENVFVHIDMEEYEVRDLTLKIVRELLEEKEFRSGIPIGIVLQAYLKDADACLDEIFSWSTRLAHPITIRLVRGAYWDQELMNARKHTWPAPVLTSKDETDAMFEHLSERILDRIPKVRLALATHNIRSIAHAMALCERKKVDRRHFEFQLLYGIGAPLAGALRAMNYAPRLYTPVGDPVLGMAYLVRRLLENVSQQSFIRRSLHAHENPNHLLQAPPPRKREKVTRKEEIKNTVYKPHPPLAFFDSRVRDDFSAAIKNAQGELGCDLPLVIDGKRRQTKKTMEVISPIDERTVTVKASMADQQDVSDAISAAQRRFPSWAHKSVRERAQYLRKAAAWMIERRYELAALEIHEVGKPYREADADLKEAIDFLHFYADAAEKLTKDEITEKLPDESNFMRPRPRGVTAVISPWNFPMAIPTGMSAAALVTGNTVVLKPAEQSLLAGWNVFQAYQEAGIPEGVVNFLSGVGDEIGPLLVNDPRVAVIAFTGSKEVGLQIAANANQRGKLRHHLKKYIIEMGGKNAAIVDETADFDQTIPAVLESAFGYAGQKCSALSRLIVLDSIFDSFMNRLILAAMSYPVGSPLDPKTRCGPVIEASAKERILTAIEEGRKTGRILFQAELHGLDQGYYVPPTMISELPEGSRLLTDEIFGPVVVIIRVKTFEEALKKANDSDFALTGGLFTRTPSHIERAKEEFEVGNLYINRAITGAIVGRHPFGGYRLSGTGIKAGSADYLREFFIERSISENVARHSFAPLEES